jgi:hypothetical protein
MHINPPSAIGNQQSKIFLPTFLIVGAVKAGTTSLHEYLQQHPEVYMSPIKETNFFSDGDMLFNHFNKDYRQDISINVDEYLKGPMDKKVHIAHVRTWEQYCKLFKNVKNEKAIGEVSNSYLYSPSAPQAIKSLLPGSLIIMILRNPVERLFSQFLMNLRLGKITGDNLLNEIENDEAKPVKGWGASHLYLEVGLYYEQVKRYYDTFPANQIHVILFDDFKKDLRGVMRELFQFIHVNSDFEIDTSQKYNEAGMPRFGNLNYWLTQTGIYTLSKKLIPENFKQSVKNLFYSKENVPKLSTTEKKWLISYYQDDVKKLSQLINKDLSMWL